MRPQSALTNLSSVLYLQTSEPLLHRLGGLVSGQDTTARAGEGPRNLAEVRLLGLAQIRVGAGDRERHGVVVAGLSCTVYSDYTRIN